MSFSAWVDAQCDQQMQQWHITKASFNVTAGPAASVEDLRQSLAVRVPNFLVESVQKIGADRSAVRFSGQLYDDLEMQTDNA